MKTELPLGKPLGPLDSIRYQLSRPHLQNSLLSKILPHLLKTEGEKLVGPSP